MWWCHTLSIALNLHRANHKQAIHCRLRLGAVLVDVGRFDDAIVNLNRAIEKVACSACSTKADMV
ncbi:MAG: hypothetical protein IPP57_14385 [Candidatus Obscuribacter sp.]|nr:hypothetical protein [Candidatus Obscuribacter sp.]MBK9771983.1 hypothetical protein [Candidatus Obscuribacter sp.]